MKEERRKGPSPEPDRGHMPLGEELDRARWTLPPVGIVLLSVLGLAVVLGVVLWSTSPAPVSSGSIDHVGVVEQHSGEHVLVAVHVTLENLGGKPLWVRHVQASVVTPEGEWADDASSAVDHERYFEAYPELREHAMQALVPETRIASGARHRGMIIFGFPVSQAAFATRESFTVTVEPYDRAPLVLREGVAQPAAAP